MNGQEPMDRRRCRTHKPLQLTPKLTARRPLGLPPTRRPRTDETGDGRDVRIRQKRAPLKIRRTRYGGPWLQGMCGHGTGWCCWVQACWICPMHGCAVFAHTHTHLHSHSHSTITVTYIASPIPSHSFSLRSNIPPPTLLHLPLAPLPKTMFYNPNHRPTRIPPSLPSTAVLPVRFHAPVARAAGPHHPVPTKRPTAMAWYPRGSVALPPPQLGGALRLRSVGRSVGHANTVGWW